LVAATGLRAATEWLWAATERRTSAEWRIAMISLVTIVLMLAMIPAALAQQSTFRDASGRITGTVSTDSNGTKTFRDSMGRTTGTATRDSAAQLEQARAAALPGREACECDRVLRELHELLQGKAHRQMAAPLPVQGGPSAARKLESEGILPRSAPQSKQLR
jgi:hypothetical protein